VSALDILRNNDVYAAVQQRRLSPTDFGEARRLDGR